jgi:hypothetical protein
MSTANGAIAANGTPVIEFANVSDLREIDANWNIYRKPADDDPAFVQLLDSIQADGINTPLEISADDYVISGHRRLAAAQRMDLVLVPVIRSDKRIEGMTKAEVTTLLVSRNKGIRVKSDAEAILEATASVDPEKAIRDAEAARIQHFNKAQCSGVEVHSVGGIRRTDPTKARKELLAAAIEILEALRAELGPVAFSARTIHYQLLAKKVRTSTYKNGYVYGSKPGSASLLSKLLTDARSAGEIDADWINDDTRVSHIYPSDDIGDYVTDESERFLRNYFSPIHRDQPHHVELLLEKNTLLSLIQKHVSQPLRLPLTSLHGYGSFPVARDVASRFEASGKDELFIVYISDLDPEGVDMPAAVKKYLDWDFGVECTMLRAAVTEDQVAEYNLPPDADVKLTSSRAEGFIAEYGNECWELDSMPPRVLVEEVGNVARGCLDIDKLNAAFAREKQSDVKLARLNAAVAQLIRESADAILNQP